MGLVGACDIFGKMVPLWDFNLSDRLSSQLAPSSLSHAPPAGGNIAESGLMLTSIAAMLKFSHISHTSTLTGGRYC